ncbi:hypothetical protein N8580_03730 [Akkermansiaceae bacterium]|nr:hypothetical protein [Akkermansiaceae bacterium]MDB4287781.1 hypothetical protein [bacterium]MDA7864231.1 hypothetical protein [Akkermansiaceae bacterium]MDA8967071.1 hypothetical protein [Akkermansiaceae bacterium]MDB4040991.1 hypothetical protein [Akkermansiaceae bacterium]
MKYLKLIVVPLVLYVVGLMAGPMIGSILVSEAEQDTTLRRDVKVNDAVFHVNLAEMRDSELPETVKTVGQITLPTVTGEGKKVIAPGRTVKLLNRNEKKLWIETTDGLAKGEVEIKQTDIFEAIGRLKMDELMAAAGPASGSQPAPAKPTPPAVVADAPQPAPAKPMVAAVVDPVPGAQPVMPTPPDPAPQPAAGAALTPEQIVEVMKKSIAAGAVKEFKMDQVTAWKAGEEEDFGGESFQTGLAAYKAETIFGVKTVQAKALIKGGAVSKWVYAKTGMEIR